MQYEEIFQTFDFLDAEINRALVQLPPVIEQTKDSIMQRRLQSNYRLWGAAAGIAIGKLIQVRA